MEDEVYAFTKNVYGLRISTSSSFSRLFLLGWINSLPVNYYYRKKFSTKKENAFPEIQAYLYDQLPVPKASTVDQKAVEDLVRIALEAKKANSEADISDTIKEIDILICLLYGFEYDDVLMMDPDFSLPKEEYDRLK